MRRVALVLAILLSSCAERWTRPGVSEAETEATLAACTAQALERHPPRLESRPIPPWERETERTCRTRNGREECTTREKPFAPQSRSVDVAAERRASARRACMLSRGYTSERGGLFDF